MKHLITTTVLLMSTAMASAQFRISENGNVGIQTFNPQSMLTVNDVGDAKTTVAFRSTLDRCLSLDGGRTGMSVTNSGTGILIQQNYNTNSSVVGNYTEIDWDVAGDINSGITLCLTKPNYIPY